MKDPQSPGVAGREKMMGEGKANYCRRLEEYLNVSVTTRRGKARPGKDFWRGFVNDSKHTIKGHLWRVDGQNGGQNRALDSASPGLHVKG